MKILYCSSCQDAIKLTTREVRKCKCGSNLGWYLDDGDKAVIIVPDYPQSFALLGLNSYYIDMMTKIDKFGPEFEHEVDLTFERLGSRFNNSRVWKYNTSNGKIQVIKYKLLLPEDIETDLNCPICHFGKVSLVKKKKNNFRPLERNVELHCSRCDKLT